MEVKTRMVGEEVFESFNESGLAVTIDMRPADQRVNQNPPELLLFPQLKTVIRDPWTSLPVLPGGIAPALDRAFLGHAPRAFQE